MTTENQLTQNEENERLKEELGRAYRCISGLYKLAKGVGLSDNTTVAYHSLTIAAARRYIREDSLDGANYFIGKHFTVMHEYLRD
jgi:hypothetical protein